MAGECTGAGLDRTIGVQDSGSCDASVRVPGEVRGGGEGTGIQQYRVGIEEADNVARFEHPHAGIRGGSETDVAFLLDDLDHWPAPPDRLGSPIARGVVHHHRRLEERGEVAFDGFEAGEQQFTALVTHDHDTQPHETTSR